MKGKRPQKRKVRGTTSRGLLLKEGAYERKKYNYIIFGISGPINTEKGSRVFSREEGVKLGTG